ncbi:hypothetical protein CsSME_00048107 [Camellia sinensis var. sinensis]
MIKEDDDINNLLKLFWFALPKLAKMQRRKGQFTSSKTISDEVGASSDWNASQGSGQEEQETL